MGAAGILGVGFAAPFAQAAVGTELLALGFYATAALFAQPGVLLAAVDAMIAAALAPLYFIVVAETEVANGAVFLVGVATLAESTLWTERLVAVMTFRTVYAVLA